MTRAHDAGGDGDATDAELALITDYLAGELTLGEMQAVERRLDRDAAFRRRVQPVLDAWMLPVTFSAEFGVAPRQPRAPSASPAEIAAGWARYREESDEAVAAPRIPGRRPVRAMLWKLAATVALLAAAGTAVVQGTDLLYGLEGPATETTTDRMRALFERTTIRGGDREPRRAALPHGSAVTLTPSSRLVVRPVGRDADSSGRGLVLSLRGEAVIEVSPETGPVFLGTATARASLTPGRYRVRSFADDSVMQVHVEAGEMRVTPREGAAERPLRAGATAQVGRSVVTVLASEGASIGDAPRQALVLSTGSNDSMFAIDTGGAFLAGRPQEGDTPPLRKGFVIDTLPGGIIRVTNLSPNEWFGTRGWRMVVHKTIAMTAGSVEPIGEIGRIVLLADGRVVVSEDRPARIRLFTPGQPIPLVLVSGGRYASDIAVFHDTLFVNAIATALLDGISLPASPPTARQLTAGRTSAYSGIDRRSMLVDSGYPSPQERLSWKSPAPFSARFSIPLTPESAFLRLGNGDVLYGRTDRDDFTITRTGRDTTRLFRRTDRFRRPVSSAERDSIFDWYEAMRPGLPRRDEIPRLWPSWQWTAEDGQGNIWVRHDGEPLFDVYTPEGILRGMVEAPFAAWHSSWAGDLVAVPGKSPDGFPRITIYRIVRSR